MSYILDALKRSEAERERERGTAPSLHGQAHRVIDPAEDEVPVVPPLKAGRLVGLGVLLAGVLAGLGWWLWSPATPSVATAPAAVPVSPQPAPPPPVTVAGAAAVPPAPSLAPPDPALAAPPPQPIPSPLPPGGPQGLDKPGGPPPLPAGPVTGGVSQPSAAPLPVLRDAPPPNPGSPAPDAASARPQPSPAAQRPTAAEPTPAPVAAPSPALPAPKTGPQRLSQLPADLRRQLPPLKVSGSVYSPDVPARMLILDGQILREGQNAGPELLIEQIGPKAAVLSFRGQRFELPYGP